jgi:tetratricopeptide (TPR) repeat protein
MPTFAGTTGLPAMVTRPTIVRDKLIRMSSKTNLLTRGKKQKALALLQRNQPAEAIPLLEQACRTDRRDAEVWFMLAAAHQKLGAFAPAAEAYRQIIALRPDYAEAYYHLGNTCMALGDAPGAIEAFRQAIRLRPDYLEAHVNLGALFELQKNHVASESYYRDALRLAPQNAELHYNLGNTLQSQERFEEAVAVYQQALTLRPSHPDTYNNLGNALARLDRYDEAIGCYEQALRLDPRLTAAHNNMGNAYTHRRRFEEAIAAYWHALAINPGYAEAETSLGNVYRHQGNLNEAIAHHRRAIEFDPTCADAHFNLAFALLATGQFREGWQEYAWHWRREGSGGRPFQPTAWDGSDLQGRTVFLHAEQGLGDELFFPRFAGQLRQRGAGHVVYRPSSKIALLLSRVSVIDRLAEPKELPSTGDCTLSVGDLPRLLGHTRADQIPSPLAHAPLPARLEAMRERLAAIGPPPYLGVTRRAGIKGKDLGLY